jgi:hypothetical protein
MQSKLELSGNGNECKPLSAGAPSLLDSLTAGGITVTGGAATVAAGSQATFTVAAVDRCGVPLVGADAVGEVRLVDAVGRTVTHTGAAHPRVLPRAGVAPTPVAFSGPGVVPGVGVLTVERCRLTLLNPS